MLSFHPSASSLFSKFNNLLAFRGGKASQSLAEVSVQSQTQSGLSLVTAEGDKVTLSTNTVVQGSGVRYNARGIAEGQALTLRGNVLESEFISQKNVTIEGNLNEQEIQDIKKVIQQVNGITRDVKSGNINAAVAKGQHLGAGDTIASIQVNIQHAESLSLKRSVLQGATNAPAQPGQQLTNSGDTVSSGLPLQDNIVPGLLASKFLSRPEPQQEERPARVIPEGQHEKKANSKEPEESLIEKVKTGVKHGAQGLAEFFEKIGEEIFRGVRTIAKLADRLKEKVEKQASRLSKAYERLAELVRDGKTEKADRLQDKIHRRVDRLERTVERTTSRINNITEKVNDKIEEALEASEIQHQNAGAGQFTGAIEEEQKPEAESHGHKDED